MQSAPASRRRGGCRPYAGSQYRAGDDPCGHDRPEPDPPLPRGPGADGQPSTSADRDSPRPSSRLWPHSSASGPPSSSTRPKTRLRLPSGQLGPGVRFAEEFAAHAGCGAVPATTVGVGAPCEAVGSHTQWGPRFPQGPQAVAARWSLRRSSWSRPCARPHRRGQRAHRWRHRVRARAVAGSWRQALASKPRSRRGPSDSPRLRAAVRSARLQARPGPGHPGQRALRPDEPDRLR